MLQNAFDAHRPQDISLYFFDIPYLNGYDLRNVPLVQRRAILQALLEPVDDEVLRFSNDFAFSAGDLLKSACDMAMEGIIGKRRDSTYVSGRSPAWIKLKCRRRQEFVIGGYSEPSGSRGEFGALLLGVYDEKGKLQYAGRVGTGFDASTLRSVKKALDAHAAAMPLSSLRIQGGNSISALARFSRRCSRDDVPGISSMLGERCKSHASAVCMTVAPSCAAAFESVADCSGVNPPSGKNGT